VLGCRNPDNPAVLAAFAGFENIHELDIFKLDLTSQDSIRAFASHVLETYSQEISVLLLCAGAVCAKRDVDSSGIERTLQINILSQALLLRYLWTRLVEPAGRETSPRVVFVASSLHKKAAQRTLSLVHTSNQSRELTLCLEHEVSPSSIDVLLDDKHWKSMSAYSISKLVQMHLFQIVVDAFSKIQDSELRPVAIAVSPGDNLSIYGCRWEGSLPFPTTQDSYLRRASFENTTGGRVCS
jgi:NAD(P)-dependent dehydrogenase (short-subunit alcohol dehydrogenase family)